jgi:hypothetical protein
LELEVVLYVDVELGRVAGAATAEEGAKDGATQRGRVVSTALHRRAAVIVIAQSYFLYSKL